MWPLVPSPRPTGARAGKSDWRRPPAVPYAGAPMVSESLFEVRLDRRDGAAVVSPAGRSTSPPRPELRSALHEPQARAETVVLDLREVTFMDSSGLGVIVGQHKRAREDGFRFKVAVERGTEVERILELSGLVSVLELTDAPEDLLAG